MVWKLLAGAGFLALAALLVVLFGNAREQQGRSAERLAARDREIVAVRAAADGRVADERRVAAAVTSYADRAAALKPIILHSRDMVTQYAATPDGRAACRGADRVRLVDELDASLFGSPGAGEGRGAVQPDAAASSAGR